MEEEKKHRIEMEGRERLKVSDVEDVESFDENKVVIYTSMGAMTVAGTDFRINKLNVDNGELIIDGFVDEIKYSEARRNDSKGGFFSGLFK